MRLAALAFALAAAPATALAQPAIAGTVRDSSHAVLPGVSVEARSSALIEGARTAITDSAGRYRIENLRPGTYAVRFTLAGWTPFEVDGVELTGSLTATVDAALTIGRITDSVNVTAELAAVDVHTARHEVTLSGDLIRAIPTVRSYNALLPFVPGVVTNVNDTVTATSSTSFPMHGGRVNEGRLALDGLTIGSPPSGNSATSYVVDVGAADEVTFTTAGGLGESETAGLVMNIVPRSGGNATHGSLFASGTDDRFQSNNLTPALQAQGLSAATPLMGVYDLSGTLGGPIVRNRLWYFVSGHAGGSTMDSARVYYNLNAGDPSQWLYSPDLSRREYSDRAFDNASERVTWQVSPRNRIGMFWDQQSLCGRCTGATPGLSEPQQVSPEAVGVLGRPLTVAQATWWSPVTDRLLLQAGFVGTHFGVGNFERTPNPTLDLIRVVEQCASGCADNGGIPGLVYRSQDFSSAYAGSYLWQGSLSYVTGSHVFKAGYQHTLMTDDRTWYTNDQNLTYRVNDGVPNQLTESISPWVNNTRVGWDGLFVQEQWTRSRLTLQGALRFDRATSWFPEQQEGPSTFLPTSIIIPETRGVDSYKDLSPRMGAAYDVFGNGRTAIKAFLGKYLDGAGSSGTYANSNPSMRLPSTTSAFGTAGVTRSWIDANGNFTPDCDLQNPAAQDLRAAGGDLCGVVSNAMFGQNVLTNNFDPSILNGWGVRPSDWDLSVSAEQQVGSRSSVNVTYTRRWFHGFTVVDNLALQPSDMTPFSIVAPLDPRLPGGGGYVISGLYDVSPDKAGQVNNLVTGASKYGDWYQYFNGIDVTGNLRVGTRLTLVGGTSTGQTVADNCAVRASLPELSTATIGTAAFGAGLNASAVTPLNPYCHVAYGVLTQLRGLGSFVVPKAELELAVTFQSKPGAQLAANYAVPNGAIAPSLGRNLSGDAPNATVNLIAPGTMYGDRINQLDLRIARTLKMGRTRTRLAMDVYNVLNSSAVLAYNNSFVPGGPWLQPMAILTPRFLRFTAELTF
jgi:Carboxypeptidase regulatory-like domain